VLRHLFLLLLFSSILFITSVDAQILDRTVDVAVKDMPLIQLINVVEKELNVEFAYNSSIIPHNVTVSADLENVPLRELLDYVFSELRIGYRELNGQLVLLKRSAPAPKHVAPSGLVIYRRNQSADETEETVEEDLPSRRMRPVLMDDSLSVLYKIKPLYLPLPESRIDSSVFFDTEKDSLFLSCMKKKDKAIEIYYANSVSIEANSAVDIVDEEEAGLEKNWELLGHSSFGILAKKKWGGFTVHLGAEISQQKEQTSYYREEIINNYTKINESYKSVYDTVRVDTVLTVRDYWVYIPMHTTDTTWAYVDKDTIWEYYLERTVLEYDTAYVSDTAQLAADLAYNRSLWFVSIPVGIGYEYSVTNNLFVGCHLGLKLTFLWSFSEEALKGQTYTNQSHFRSIMFGAQGGIDVGYEFLPEFAVVIGGYYHHQMNSLYADGFGVNRSFSSFDVKCALRYIF